MNIIVIIVVIGVLVMLTSITINVYQIINDIDICYKCPYSNSLYCYRCRRECSIKTNRYNKLKN